MRLIRWPAPARPAELAAQTRAGLISAALACCALVCGALMTPVIAGDRLADLAGGGGIMLSSPNGETLTRLNQDRAMIPASLLKIPLAQVALTALGEDFRFETHFYRNGSGDLLIRGLGDPFLVSEEIALIAERLAQRGLTEVTRLVMDDSAFEPNPELPRQPGVDDPYAARNSALAANFNTVYLARTDSGKLVSGESQTPLTSLARQFGERLSSGQPQRINLSSEPLAGLRQAQQLFLHFLARSGVTVADMSFYRETVSAQWTLYYRHQNSRSLRDVLRGMLAYSNNFIANQLFLTLGAQQGGYPATVEAARTALQRGLADLYGAGFGVEPARLLMHEGSGLDREQFTSADGMMHILKVFLPEAGLLPAVNGVLRKSGTLTGVYNLAGYLSGADGLYPFVILTTQPVNNRDTLLQILQQKAAQSQPLRE